jgi:hypothetical protein
VTRPQAIFFLAATASIAAAQEFHPTIPKAWDDSETTSFELPLAQPDRSPRYLSAKEYYSIPVRPAYRTYPYYAPNKEPAGYWESLHQKEPEVVFDPAKLRTKEDWIRGGEFVFDAPLVFIPADAARVRYQANFRAVPMPTTPEGIVPSWYYVIRKKGIVEMAFGGCAECHIRVMPDGTPIKGAQTNIPIAQSAVWRWPLLFTGPQVVQRMRAGNFAPWAANQDDWERITIDEMIRRRTAMPPGVLDREGTSTKHPVKIPSLIGIGDLKYLDATGLSRNRSIGDLMRYAIVNQGMINFAHYGDYYQKTDPSGGNTRYSDEQLYALSLYLLSLKPPPNPNPLDDEARQGQVVFGRQGCAGCHPAPLYTNNKLTPAKGFTIPDALRKSEAIMEISVGTDPGLALETRRGTGFYKVPSLRGVWMRSVFGPEGQAASLEEWFDPARLNTDYVPKGFHLSPGPIEGHEFGVRLSAADRRALIAFLKTL